MEKRQKWQQAQELLKQRAQHGPLGQWLGRWLEGYTAPLGATLYIGGPPGLYREKYQSSPGGTSRWGRLPGRNFKGKYKTNMV